MEALEENKKQESELALLAIYGHIPGVWPLLSKHIGNHIYRNYLHRKQNLWKSTEIQ